MFKTPFGVGLNIFLIFEEDRKYIDARQSGSLM